VAQIYIYLRENQSKNLISLKTQQSELKALQVKMEKQQRFGDSAQTPGAGPAGGAAYNCSHCKSILRGLGRMDYLSKDKSVVEARRAASLVLAQLPLPDVPGEVEE